MAENKTKPGTGSVREYLEKTEDPDKRQDCYRLVSLMKELTGEEPVMWGDSIIGFGTHRYRYASGREGAWFLTGFAPRKQYLTVYIMGYLENFGNLLKDLGKFKQGKGCLYIKKLDDIDLETLKQLIRTSISRLETT